MDDIQSLHEKVWASSRKAKAIDQTQTIIEILQKARDAIAKDPTSAQVTLARLQNPVKTSFDNITANLKEIHGSHNRYAKLLDKQFKDKPLPVNDVDPLASNPTLINRAVYLHLLREGLFDVASTFHSETASRARSQQELASIQGIDIPMEHPLGLDRELSTNMQEQFANMYYILRQLREEHNLQPAIEWARKNSTALETRGSNLEFELCALHFVDLYLKGSKHGDISLEGPLAALAYAQKEFQSFRKRYPNEVSELIGAIACYSNLGESGYRHRFNNTTAWDEVALSFTREFCSLLELSADSPLYIAATAGTIALPQLLKLEAIKKVKKTEWTSQNEMPVETPLPPSYHFHSVFVCPVSKEQGTDQNPPMILPCCHVVAQESLSKLGKGAKFKCPYCPIESHPRDAKRVFI